MAVSIYASRSTLYQAPCFASSSLTRSLQEHGILCQGLVVLLVKFLTCIAPNELSGGPPILCLLRRKCQRRFSWAQETLRLDQARVAESLCVARVFFWAVPLWWGFPLLFLFLALPTTECDFRFCFTQLFTNPLFAIAYLPHVFDHAGMPGSAEAHWHNSCKVSIPGHPTPKLLTLFGQRRKRSLGDRGMFRDYWCMITAVGI